MKRNKGTPETSSGEARCLPRHPDAKGGTGARRLATRFPPLALMAFGSAFLPPQAAWADDATGGTSSAISGTYYGGFGGAGNGQGGGGAGQGTASGSNNGTGSGTWAAGGAGGISGNGVTGGAGGARLLVVGSAGYNISLSGHNGAGGTADSLYGSGGGGGGATVYVGANAAGSYSSFGLGGGTFSGGNGGNGGDGGTSGGGGGGGGGGAAVVSAGSPTPYNQVTNSGTLVGGNGGNGGAGMAGGGGGGGGDGILAKTATAITNDGTIRGGNGGNGGDSVAGYPGAGGNGGAGIDMMSANVTVTNSGTISGGNGGAGGSGGASTTYGAGGAGIITYGNDTITNTGTISGGLSGDGVTRSDAILFNGTGNLLHLGGGSAISGAIELASGAGASIDAQASGLSLSAPTILGNSSTLTFDTSTTHGLTVSGGISGTGNLVVGGGAAAVILTGGNSYSGATTINASGLLQVGDGGTTGTLGTGNVVNNGTLAFNRSDTLTYGGAISGSGALMQSGGGILVLTGDNSYAGTTTINATGTLRVGNGGTTGTLGTGNVVNNGTLAFNRSDALTYGGAISGSGTLAQNGGGPLVLSGTSASFAGHTEVNNGKLTVNGTLGGSVTVAGGATLGGIGTVGAVTVNAGGTLAPGNSIGTLTVNGNVTFNSGSVLAVEIAGGGAADKLVATGSAALAGTVQVTAVDPKLSYRSGQTYTILSAAGGVTGTFAGVTSSSSFLGLRLNYGANDVTLGLTIAGNFAEAANTRNQKATAGGLDTLAQSGNSLVLYNKLLMLSSDQARAAEDQLSGEAHASYKGALLGDSSFWRDGLTSRLRNLRDDSAPGPAAAGLAPSGWWISGHGARGEQDGDSSNAAKLKTSAGGVMGGVDTLLRTGWHAGLAGGYGRSDLRVDGRSSSARMDSYTVGAYTGARMGNVGLRFGLAHTWHALETTRESSFADFSETNRASYRARTAQAFGEAGFTLRWNATSLEPYVGLAYVSLRSSGYDESGMAGLHAQASGQELTYATLGARLRRVVRLGNAGGLLRAGLAWRHAGGDTTTAATHAFDGSNSFTVTGVPIARETALLEAGLDLTLAKNTDLTVSYNGQYASQAKQHGITANLRWRF